VDLLKRTVAHFTTLLTIEGVLPNRCQELDRVVLADVEERGATLDLMKKFLSSDSSAYMQL
jgi:hypothetical protein